MGKSIVDASKVVVQGLCTGALALGLVGSIGETAQAQTFKFEWDRDTANFIADPDRPTCSTCYESTDLPMGFNDRIGVHDFIGTTYNRQTQELTWESTFSNSTINGGWLVLSDGPNPKKNELEFSIFYLDGLNNKLTAYAYNGQNNSDSWKQNPLLQSWDDALTFTDDGNGNTALSFSIDATGINSRGDLGSDWKGAGFSKEVGIWFHAAEIDELAYDANGGLTKVDWAGTNWYDTKAMDTETVPEPFSMIGAGLALGVGAALKNRKN